MLFYGYNRLAAVHLECDGSRVEDISVSRALLDDLIVTVGQLFGHHELAGDIGVIGVDVHRCGIVDVLHDIFAGIGVAHLEADTRRRDDLAGFRVLLDDLYKCFVRGIVDEEAINLAVLADIDIEGFKQFFAFPALCLTHGVFAVRQILGFGKAVLIAYKDISLGFLGVFIAACSFQIHLKFRAFFGRFDFGAAVVGVLDYGDFSLDYIFEGVERLCKIVFNGIEPGFCADVQTLGVKQISLGGADLTNRPIVAADIILGGKLTICVGGVGVNELVALIDAVLCTCKRGVALRQTLFRIGFRNRNAEFLENIVKGFACHLIPLDSDGLLFGNDIASRSVDFFEGIAVADQHILKFRHTVFVGDGILVHGNSRKGCAVEPEFHAFGQSILGGFGDLQSAAL